GLPAGVPSTARVGRRRGGVVMIRAACSAAIVIAAAAPLAAQNVQPLSLRDAEARALQNHPQVIAGQYAASAGADTVREVRSTYFPTVYGNVTGAAAQDG